MSTLKTGVTASIGFLIGIGAWSITFITLIWGYIVYRLRAGQWLYAYIDQNVVIKALINTVLILLSSAALHFFIKDKKRFLFVLGIVFGLLFIEGQWALWQMLLARGLTFKGSVAGSFFYLLTGFHAVHMAVGILILLPLGIPIVLKVSSPRNESRFYFTVKFWDLLAVFWLVLLLLIFVLK